MRYKNTPVERGLNARLRSMVFGWDDGQARINGLASHDKQHSRFSIEALAQLTLTRSSFFTKREHTWKGGGATPRAISLLSVIELRNKHQRIAWDVPNPTVLRLDLFRSTVDLPGQVKQKVPFPGASISSSFSSIASSLFEIER